MATYVRQVAAGKSFMVMRRSKPIFAVGPVEQDGWETVVDFTSFRKNGISAKELLTRLKRR
ncbi:MAG: hypothetical protein PHT12_01730 [Patescibacteria group bacterium]|nr:hypothetical protein [Patescibacteria group bacterium]